MREASWSCRVCARKNPLLFAFCGGCGARLGAGLAETRFLRLSGPPVAVVPVGGLLFCLFETGTVEVVSLGEWSHFDQFQLCPHPLVGERPLIVRGLLLAAWEGGIGVADLWHRYLASEVDRSTTCSLGEVVVAELCELGDGVYILTGSGGSANLHRFRPDASVFRREGAVFVDLGEPAAFAGVVGHQDTVYVGEAFGDGLWVVQGDAVERHRLGVVLSFDALRAHRRGVIATGSRGELYLLRDGRLQRYLAPAFDVPLQGLGLGDEWAILCHGSWTRAIQLEKQSTQMLRLPQGCGVGPAFDDTKAYLVSDEGSLYRLGLTEHTCHVEEYQPLFLSPGGTPLPPVLWGEHLLCFGGDGELLRLHLPTREGWTPLQKTT